MMDLKQLAQVFLDDMVISNINCDFISVPFRIQKKQTPALGFGLVRHLLHVMVSPSNCSNVAYQA